MNKYNELYMPKHHRAKVNGYVYEHILVAEEMLGRPLKDEEVVHHVDRDRSNNNTGNLMVFASNSAHSRHHMGGIPVRLPDGTFDCVGKGDAYCNMCGTLLRTKNARLCQICLHIKQRVCEWPTKDQLDEDKKSLRTNVAIAKKYGVSEATVRKWKKIIQ